MRRIAALSAVVLLTIGLAACGDDDDGTIAADDDTESTTTTTAAAADDETTTTAVEAEPAGDALVQMESSGTLGDHIVDPEGMTLYMFVPDSLEASACNEGCSEAWPPLLTEGTPTGGDGVDPALLGTAPRDDGSLQVTYNGHRLYIYSGDSAPGDANGQGVGDVWYAVNVTGEPIS